ncbi:hypothetical protein ACH518_04175 [Methylomonas sp. HW2-6]|uniref:hypothetical protein n=1 Tax=Methylomonas sp. HW2-6 TaxID=3376687 RepID=UPI004042AC12
MLNLLGPSIEASDQSAGQAIGYQYYLSKPVSERDLDIMRHLDELHLKHPFIDARQLRDQLNLQDIKVGRKHVKSLIPEGINASTQLLYQTL